jgi:hypothetical protein
MTPCELALTAARLRSEVKATAEPSLSDRLKAAFAARQAEQREIRDTLAGLSEMIASVANDDKSDLSARDLEALASIDAELDSIIPDVAEEAPAPAAPVAKLVKSGTRKRRRRAESHDREDLCAIRIFEASTPAPAASSTPSSSSSLTLTAKGESDDQTTAKEGKRRTVKHWDKTTDVTKLPYYNRALDSFGAPFAFSLNLSPDVIEAANSNTRGFLDLVRRHVVRELKEMGREVPTWLMIETTDDGRPHLHGGLSLSSELTAAEIEAATRGLNRAGGLWRGRGAEYQTDIRREYEPDGWANYCLKRLGRTKKHLRAAAGLDPKAKVAIVSVTWELRTEAERLYNDIRDAMRAA